MQRRHWCGAIFLLAACSAILFGAALAEAETAIDVTIKDHHFIPSEIHVPAGKPAVLNIKNEDATAEELIGECLNEGLAQPVA